ncbi:hypothetical protein [Streptomyces sichuanensis]|nr:hypothetical protein [Streptomyces sichuanensis]
MLRNLLDVFNEPDPDRRAKAVARCKDGVIVGLCTLVTEALPS